MVVRPIAEQVVVITGASSGIGRCTAEHCAGRGAKVVLFARGRDALDDVARSIRQGGGDAHVVTGDVANEEDIERLADEAIGRYGRIDTWVNNAALFIQGRVTDIEPAEYRRMVEVNLLGVIFGTRSAILRMRGGGGGVVVQVSSIVGQRGAPWFSAYSASKHGIDGFCDSARAELWGSDIHISTVYLPAVDTPIYQHARGKFGTNPKPAPPVADPLRAAKAIARMAVTGTPKKHIGLFHFLYLAPGRVSPRLGDWFLHHSSRFTYGHEPSVSDNFDQPSTRPAGAVHGGWRRSGWKGFTLGEIARVLPVETALGVLGLAAAGWLLARRL